MNLEYVYTNNDELVVIHDKGAVKKCEYTDNFEDRLLCENNIEYIEKALNYNKENFEFLKDNLKKSKILCLGINVVGILLFMFTSPLTIMLIAILLLATEMSLIIVSKETKKDQKAIKFENILLEEKLAKEKEELECLKLVNNTINKEIIVKNILDKKQVINNKDIKKYLSKVNHTIKILMRDYKNIIELYKENGVNSANISDVDNEQIEIIKKLIKINN